MERAQAHMEAGNYDQAEIEYLNALRLNPTNRVAFRRLGEIALDQGRLPQAYTRLSQARSLDTNDIDVQLQLLICQVVGGAPDAFTEIASFLNRVPTNGKAILLLADTAKASTNLARARQLIGSLPAAAKETAEYHVATGTLALRDRDLVSAEAAYQRALALDPKSSEVHAALGNLFLSKNDRTNALAEFKAAAGFATARSAHQIRYVDFLASLGDTNAALGHLDQLSEKAPDFLPARLRQAEYAMSAGDLVKCEGLLDAVLRRDAINLDALQLMAQLRFIQGDHSRAVSELKRALDQYPRLPQLHYRLAVISMADNDLAQANRSLNDALTIYPDYSEALLALAQLNIRRGELDPAIKHLTKVLKTSPQLLPAQILLATAYRGRGDLEGALKIYQAVARVATNNPQPVFLAGLVLREQGKPAQARESFETALKRDPGFDPAIEQLVYLDLAQNNYAAAQTRASQQIARSPSNAVPYLLLAKVYLAETNLIAAKEVLQKATAMAPNSSAPMALLAKVHVAAKEEEAALEALTAVVARNTNDIASWMQIGVLREAAGDYASARKAYEKLLEVNPQYGPALNNLAYILSEHLNENKRAYELASRARELFPKDPYVADTLGWVLYRSGDYARALALVSESVRRFPENPELQFHLGMIHYMMGEEVAARIALQNAVERGDPKASWIEDARKRLQVLATDAASTPSATIQNLEKLAASTPGDPVLQMRLASAYERAGQWQKAVESCEQALAANTNLMPAALRLADLWSRRLDDLPRALGYAKRARELDPSDPRTAHILGRIAFEAARTAKDIQWSHGLLQEGARRLADDPEALFDLSRAAYAMGQVSNAIAGMQKVAAWNPPSAHAEAARLFLEINALTPTAGTSGTRVAALLQAQPDYVPALMVSAMLLQSEGKPALARDQYERILGRYPTFSPAYKPLAVLYSGELKDLQKAYEYATKAREADPTDLQAARILGELSYERGLYTAAVPLLKQSSQAFPSDGDLYYMLGLAQHKVKAGDANSKAALTRALALAPGSRFAAEAKAVLASMK